MIIKHKGKRYDDQIGSGKLGEKITSGIRTIGKRFSNATATATDTARTKIASDWGTHKGVRGKAKMVGKLVGATLMSPVAASLAMVTSASKGLTSSLPGAIKYGYHRIHKNIQQGKLANTERKQAAYNKFDELKRTQDFNQKQLNDSLKDKGNFSRVLGKYFGLGLTRKEKLLQREAQRQKTLKSLTTQGESVRSRVLNLATEIDRLTQSNQQTPDAKPNKKVLKQLKSLEIQKAILNSEIAFTESEKARKQEKYKLQNTRKLEKLQNQLERRKTRLQQTTKSLTQNENQMKLVYKSPSAIFSGLVKSAYKPSKAGTRFKEMYNELKKSGGIGRTISNMGSFTKKLLKGTVSKGYKYSGLRYAVGKTFKGIKSVKRAFTPNEDIKTTTDAKLKNTLTRVGKLQNELDNPKTSTKRKLEIQKEMKPLKSEAYKLSQIQSKLAHYYNLKSAKENIEMSRLTALSDRYKKISAGSAKYEDKINKINAEIEKRNEKIQEYNKYTTQYKYNKNPKITNLLFDDYKTWRDEALKNREILTETNEYNNPIYSYTEPDGTIVRYITKPTNTITYYLKETIQPTIQKIKPNPVNF
jgi:DNA repair exonuclease SbcCD ATPase subunit